MNKLVVNKDTLNVVNTITCDENYIHLEETEVLVDIVDIPESDVVEGYYINEDYEQVWNTRNYNDEELLDQKQSLFNAISDYKIKAYSDYSDGVLIKYSRKELNDKKANDISKDYMSQVADWAQSVEDIDDSITIDNTQEEIQGVYTAIDTLCALFPYTTQEEYNLDGLEIL